MKRILLGIFIFSVISMQAGDHNPLPPVLAVIALLQGQAYPPAAPQAWEAQQQKEQAQRRQQRDQQRQQQRPDQRRQKGKKGGNWHCQQPMKRR